MIVPCEASGGTAAVRISDVILYVMGLYPYGPCKVLGALENALKNRKDKGDSYQEFF